MYIFNSSNRFIIDRNSAVPLYLQLAGFLKEKVISGEFAEGMRLPPEAELARMIGIHRITLRKSLHILSSQNLITQKPHCGTFVTPRAEKKIKVGIISDPRIAGTYMTTLMLEIENSIHQYPGVEQVFISLSEDDEQANIGCIANKSCDALLVPFGREYVFKVLDHPKFDLLPIVFINRYDHQLKGLRYSVSLDQDAIKRGIEYLRSQGHRRIAYITSDDGNPTLKLRNREFQACMSNDLTMFVGDNTQSRFQFAKETTIELCHSGNPPTAILTPGIPYTSGVWHGVLESGLKVPRDISILGFDPMTDAYPMASTLDQPIDEMVKKAVTLLYELCCGKTFLLHLYLYKAVIHDCGSIKEIKNKRQKQKRGLQ